jgi:hypothetical protein
MTREDRWQNLVSGAFHLEEAMGPEASREGAAASRQLALRYLESVLEVFPVGVDPLEDFEGYAVRRMALALRRVLEKEKP